IDPSKRKILNPASFSGFSSKINIFLNCENTTDFVAEFCSLDATRSFSRAETFEDKTGLEKDASFSASEEVGGAEKRSEVVIGRRQRGQEDLVCFRVFKIQAWQKM
ncbi:hypothetical protein TorRG33x02_035610, partial [Trema orientale]